MTQTTARTVRLHDRPPRRRSAGLARRIRRWLASCLVAALLVFAGWVVFASPWLAVQQVSVRGLHTLSRSAVVGAAEVPLGTPMVRLNLDDVSRRVAHIPAVAHVSVHRSWPHTVELTVTERVPVATLARSGRWWEVDRHGVVFDRTSRPEHGLPQLRIPVSAGQDAVTEAARVVVRLPARVRRLVREIRAPSMDSVTLVLRDGRQVVWGSSAQSTRKARVLAVLLKRHAKVYNVSVPELPTTSG